MESVPQNNILVLIIRNLEGLADMVEIAQLREWLGKSEANRQYFEQARNIWVTSDNEFDPETIDTAKALNKVLAGISEAPAKSTLWFYWQKIAAVIILPVILGSFLLIYFHSPKAGSTNGLVYNEIYAAYGTRTAIKLADSTVVWLNSGSRLRYPDKFTEKTRKVYLKGEAYFEVKSDISRPFIVQTSSMAVKATGTKFCVLEHESNPITEVTLVSGKVFVNELGDKSELISELSPNQQLKYNIQTGIKSITEGDTYKSIAWKDGKLIFRNESFSEVVEKISRFYNVDIELRGTELKKYRYRATFQDESLDEVLKLLKLSSPISFFEVKRKPLADGSFPKKKVIIFPVN